MQDRFKFRAWYYDKDDENDSDNNKMFYNAQDTYDCLCGNPPLNASSFGDIIDDERWVVDQCTGLKDKNGKLIYEGDLIKEPANKYPLEIYYDKGAWLTREYRKNGNNEQLLYVLINCYGVEVIGNIHENADLLGAEQ